MSGITFSFFFYAKHLFAESQKKPNQLPLYSDQLEDMRALNQGTNFNAKGLFDSKDLDLAITDQDLYRTQQILSQTVNKGKQINPWNIKLALILFFKKADLKTIQKNIEKGERLNQWDKYGLTPLHYMSHEGNLKLVKQLLSLEVDLNIKDKYNQKTALYYALSKNKIDTAVELVSAGANVNESNDFGKTLLHFILEREDLELAKTLIEKGADVNTRNLITNETALYLALRKGSLNDIEYLLKKGADMSIISKLNGKTAFQFAIQQENVIAVTMMIKAGTDLYKRDASGRTVLELTNNKELLGLLISAGALIDALDKNNKTLLERAWKAKNLEKVKFLAERGAELNTRDEKDKSLLHHAFKEKDWEEKVDFLIKIGMDINSQGENKRTLLYYILKRGSLIQLRFLLEKGAYINIQDNLGQTPLHYAVKKGWFNKVKLLVKNGADLTIKDNQGKTVFDLTNWNIMKDYLEKQQSSSCKDIFKKLY